MTKTGRLRETGRWTDTAEKQRKTGTGRDSNRRIHGETRDREDRLTETQRKTNRPKERDRRRDRGEDRVTHRNQ